MQVGMHAASQTGAPQPDIFGQHARPTDTSILLNLPGSVSTRRCLPWSAPGSVPYSGEGYALLLPAKWNPSKEFDFPGVALRYHGNVAIGFPRLSLAHDHACESALLAVLANMLPLRTRCPCTIPIANNDLSNCN